MVSTPTRNFVAGDALLLNWFGSARLWKSLCEPRRQFLFLLASWKQMIWLCQDSVEPTGVNSVESNYQAFFLFTFFASFTKRLIKSLAA